jgi:bacterioferritin-associated ferredoxin
MNRTFAELLAIASDKGYDLHGLAQATGCGIRCGLCVAYLKRCLSTGETVITELLPPETLMPRKRP